MNTAVVVLSAIKIHARGALLLYTSRSAALGFTAIRMMMERAFLLVGTRITI
jgi:hypothetical protein